MGEDHISDPLDRFKVKTARLHHGAAGTSTQQEHVVIISPEIDLGRDPVLALFHDTFTKQGYINTLPAHTFLSVEPYHHYSFQ